MWALTVQSQLSPGDGHRTGSGNVPGAACGDETREGGEWSVESPPQGRPEARPTPRSQPGGLSPSLLPRLSRSQTCPLLVRIQHPPVLTHGSLRGALCKPRGPPGGQSWKCCGSGGHGPGPPGLLSPLGTGDSLPWPQSLSLIPSFSTVLRGGLSPQTPSLLLWGSHCWWELVMQGPRPPSQPRRAHRRMPAASSAW